MDPPPPPDPSNTPPIAPPPNRYVVAKDMRLNTVSISRRYHEPDKRRDAFTAGPFNWLSPVRPSAPSSSGSSSIPLLVKVRHGPNTAECQVLLGTAAEVGAWAQAAAAAGRAAGAEDNGSSSSSSSPRSDDSSSSRSVEWLVDDILGSSGRTSSPSSSSGAEQYGLVLLNGRDQGLAAGQYAVLYQDGVCLGSAKILGAVGAREAAEALEGAGSGALS